MAKIAEVALGTLSLPLAKPFKTALRTVTKLTDTVLRLTDEDGRVGYGEAPATAVITGETTGSITYALAEVIAPYLLERDASAPEDVLGGMDKLLVHNTSAKAAADMAVYDLMGREAGIPLWRMLGGAKSSFETDLTISVNPTEEMVRDSEEAVRQGFTTLKIKVGKDAAADAERLSAIRRAVGDSVALRIDANQGWSVREAVRIIRTIEDAGVHPELVEQPVAAADLEGLKVVSQQVSTPILADEAVFSPADALRVLREHCADFINIKLMKTGGILPALRLAALAESFGVNCMIGCMLESRISVAAAASLCAAKRVITMADLDGPSLCSIDPFTGGPRFDGALITMTDDAGIGVDAVPVTDWKIIRP